MKHLQKFASLVLAMALLLSLSVNGFAATVTPADPAGPASITVNIPEGVTEPNTYKIYKVFDATAKDGNISYTLPADKTTPPAGFEVDAAGNVAYSGDGDTLTPENIAAIAAFVTEADLMATVVTEKDEKNFTVEGLPYGYYYITTTTGSVVTVDSTNPNATVNDKNTAPELDKSITNADSIDEAGEKAIAQVGKNVTFQVDIAIGSGAENYVFHDKMDSGLSYNDDVTVWIGESEVADSNYDTATQEGDTLTVSFDNTYISTLTPGTVLTITYTAKITSDALTIDAANNTAWLDYGDENHANSTPVDETEVYNAKFTVNKTDGEGEPLADAGFVLKNEEGKYYCFENGEVTWVEKIEDATEYTSDAEGSVPAFTGLCNGTYTLVENTVPDGYNRAADFTFTIAAADFTAANLEQSSTVINNAGSELPSTGGMGTTLFYTLGSVLTLGALILLITKKRVRGS